MTKSALATYIETQNIARFQALLETETVPDKRKVLALLLEQEKAKHAARQ